jgi:fumarate hydratase class I
MEPLDMSELRRRGAVGDLEQMRLKIWERVNASGIGAQGLGGATTVLDVKIKTFPTHAASMPVALIPNCAATRHVHFELDGSGPASFEPPDLSDWPEIVRNRAAKEVRRVALDGLSRAEIATWRAGERLLLSGRMLTGRDAAHKRLVGLIQEGRDLPVSLRGKVIYYVGPVDAVGEEAVGPAGPTTANRMDRFTEVLLRETGLLAMIGKAERGEETRRAIAKHGAAYLIAVGGAGYLISKAIKASRPVAFAELGMEAIHEFEVEEMPVTVAIDAEGTSIHEVGPKSWRQRHAKA